MPSGESGPKAGRPKNVNERQLHEAVEGLRAELLASGEGGVVCSRGQFFLHLMTGLAIHRGEAAFNPQFLDTIRNNANDFYEAYRQISTGTHEVESTTRQLLDEAQQRLRAVEQEKTVLADRTRELEEERVALLGAVAEEAPA